MPRRVLARLAALLALAGCHAAHPPPTSDVYVWQRAWRPALAEALRDAADRTHAWRVLAAEADAAGRLRPVAIVPAALAATRRPVVLVVRIDGQLAGLDGAALVRDIVDLRQRWQAQGLAPVGIEIDHDCASARLPDYATWLAQLRRGLGAQVPLSITALPAWLASPDLDAVLAQVDESSLQVHAVRQPRAGLFDAALARQWADAWARRSPKPFRVALPTYGTRVGFDADGRIADITSEAPTLAAADERRELSVSPAAVAAFMQALADDPPRGWIGWTWFRLPTTDDRRAWRLATWRALVDGRPLAAPATLAWQASAGDAAGTYDAILGNAADVDADLPPRLALPAACTLADGVNGFHLAAVATAQAGPALQPDSPGLLAPHARRVVGWARCARPPQPLLN